MQHKIRISNALSAKLLERREREREREREIQRLRDCLSRYYWGGGGGC